MVPTSLEIEIKANLFFSGRGGGVGGGEGDVGEEINIGAYSM